MRLVQILTNGYAYSKVRINLVIMDVISHVLDLGIELPWAGWRSRGVKGWHC